jgi:2-phosphosulfolactate phosphatase
MSRPITLHVHLLPQAVEPKALSGCVAVIIDVLRASTTIATALFHGAKCLHLATTPEEAREWAARSAPEDRSLCLLGGERGGVRLEGFDLGNSPLEYAAERVGGREVIFTTTNGTAAALRARSASAILFGSPVNLSVLVRALAQSQSDIHLICAGTRGGISADDVAAAGLIARQLLTFDHIHAAPDDSVSLVLAATPTPDQLERALRAGIGGRDLTALGFDADIAAASRIDAAPVIPAVVPAPDRMRVGSTSGTRMTVEAVTELSYHPGGVWREPLPPEVLVPGVHARSVRPVIAQPTIETQDLYLRSLVTADIDSLMSICGDLRVSSMTRTIPHPYIRADAERFIESHSDTWALGKGCVYGLFEKSTGELVGSCGGIIDAIDLRAEIGYMIRPDRWGKGYASQALKEITACLFNHFPLRKLTAHYLCSNPASGRVLEKAGFVREGVLKKQAYKHGVEHDLVVMGLWRV